MSTAIFAFYTTNQMARATIIEILQHDIMITMHLHGVLQNTVPYTVGTYIAYQNEKVYGIFHQIKTIPNTIHCYFRGYFLLYAIAYTPHMQLEQNILHSSL
jgi:translation initiation factor RLI1